MDRILPPGCAVGIASRYEAREGQWITAVLSQRISGLYERERYTGACRDDSTHLPTAGNPSHGRVTLRAGNSVEVVYGKVLPNIEIAWSMAIQSGEEHERRERVLEWIAELRS